MDTTKKKDEEDEMDEDEDEDGYEGDDEVVLEPELNDTDDTVEEVTDVEKDQKKAIANDGNIWRSDAWK